MTLLAQLLAIDPYNPDMPSTAYLRTPDMWTGPYGDNRRELLQFCIDRLVDDELHLELTKLKQNGPELLVFGICNNLPFSSDSTHGKRLKKHFTHWPSFSGDIQYPIEGHWGLYAINPDKWSDPRRHDLLDFLLEQTK